MKENIIINSWKLSNLVKKVIEKEKLPLSHHGIKSACDEAYKLIFDFDICLSNPVQISNFANFVTCQLKLNSFSLLNFNEMNKFYIALRNELDILRAV